MHFTLLIWASHLVTALQFCTTLKPGCIKVLFVGSPPGSNSIGTLSPKACAAPGNEFSDPGPCCIAKTPILLPFVVRLNLSTMAMPIRSCLHRIRLDLCLHTSLYQWLSRIAKRYSVPSLFRTSAMTLTPSIVFSSRVRKHLWSNT